MCHVFVLEWLKKCNVGLNGIKQGPIWGVSELDKQVIRDAKWLGRNQVLNITPNLTYFLDGAHTIESIKLCTEWFLDLYPKSQM